MSKYMNFGNAQYIGKGVSVNMSRNNINVNGVNIKVPNGASISVENGVLYIDGKKYEGEEVQDKEVVSVVIEGNVGNVNCACDITVNGNINGDIRASRDVDVKNIIGNINAGRDVDVDGDVTGRVSAGRDIDIDGDYIEG